MHVDAIHDFNRQEDAMKIIVAVDEKWGIGKEGKLLCHLSDDLKYFKEKTTGKTIVMGRVTLEGFPGKKGLPNRRNLVLSHDENFFAEGAETISSEEELWSALSGESTDDVFIVGGAKVYEAFLQYCDTCYVTKIYEDFDADRFFPNLDENDEFSCTELSDVLEDNGIKYQFMEYKRV